jgi:hypothetical protein
MHTLTVWTKQGTKFYLEAENPRTEIDNSFERGYFKSRRVAREIVIPISNIQEIEIEKQKDDVGQN